MHIYIYIYLYAFYLLYVHTRPFALGLVATAAALESTNTYIKAYVKTMDGLI